MKKYFIGKGFFCIFFLVFFLTACTTHEKLNPPFEPYDLFFIPPQVTYRTEYFSFQPPLSRDWGLQTNINQRASRINKTRITIGHRNARIWVNVLYLKLVDGKNFKNQRELINAFIAGEKGYLAGNFNAPITETHLHQGFKGLENPLTPRTEKINGTYFKLLKWHSRSVDSQELFMLNLYITPALDLNGLFAIVVVSSENSLAAASNINRDIDTIVGSFKALK